jgi:biotin--protein ligase
MNVLVYSGPGTSVESVKCCVDTLRRLLSPYYCVLAVNGDVICNEPWMSSTSLLTIPGGADLPYCKELGEKGNSIITKFIRQGGRYVGFCAGAYYASTRVEFAVGDPSMEVSGSRDLKFFPGITRGPAFGGFAYGKDSGITAANIKVLNGEPFASYFNGGPCFVDAKNMGNGVEVLAEYEGSIDVEGDSKGSKENTAAAVYCPVGKGCAFLAGFHPEYGPSYLKTVYSKSERRNQVTEIIDQSENERLKFLAGVLKKMGLKVNEGDSVPAIPRLSRLKLTSSRPERLKMIVQSMIENIGLDENNVLQGSNDPFRICDSKDTTFKEEHENNDDGDQDEEQADLNKVVKAMDVYYDGSYPDPRETPHFNHKLYFDELSTNEMGQVLQYGEVVTSTSTMLEKNYNLLRYLPHGTISVGTVQVAGRGRGNNVWVNPAGVLAVSGILRIPVKALSPNSPIVFIQYLVALAMVEAIREYGPGYEEMPIRMKWPNDIYARKEGANDTGVPSDYIKVSGVLLNTNILDGVFYSVFGIGTNVSNAAPTISLNLVLEALNEARTAQGKSRLPPYTMEKLLARFMGKVEGMFHTFYYRGFGAFEDLYYRRWLHSDTVVTIQDQPGKARVRGVSLENGMLVVEKLDVVGRPSGEKIELQPDGNSFDMMKGMLKKKE